MPESRPENSKLEILIVDDSATDRAIFKRYLTQNKFTEYNFYEAESIRESLEIIKSAEPNCVLLDYDLPDGNGMDLINRVNSEFGINSIPIVILSGFESIETALETTRHGAQDYLVKNRATAADLVRAIDNAIDKVRLYKERETANQKIRASEEKYRMLFDSMDEGFCVIEMIFDDEQNAVDYRFLEVNGAFEKQTGLSDVQGELVSNIVPDIEKSWLEIYGKVALTGIPERVENRVDRLNRWYDVYAFRFSEADNRQVAVLFNDISERRKAEEKLRESEQSLSTLAETVPQLVWMARPDGSIFWYNRNWYDFTGTQPEQMENDGWKTVHDPEMLPQIVSRWQHSLETGTPFEMEYPLRRKDGQFRWFLTRVNPLYDESGNIVRWFGTNTDIEEMRQIRIQAEQANRLKDDFLATLSHELRTPLNAILGWSQIVLTRQLSDAETKNALSIIDRSARAQKQLIEDILDVSRIITGKFRLDVKAIDLVKIIAAAIETARPGADAKNISLQTLLDPQATNLSGDPDRLQQVIWNLLSNAVKFTPKNGRIQVRLERVNSHVEVIVSDTGKGIEEEFLPFIFDRFRQFDGSMTRRQGGLGLGLALVRQIAELHGGTASVSSKGKDQGATFTICLPLLPLRIESLGNEPRVHPEVVNSILSEEVRADLSGLKIMIVDDEADSRELLELTLKGLGAAITLADSASFALKAIEKEKFDLIISDIGMPDEDGFSLIKKIRNLPAERDRKIPAIALTAYARAEDRIKALQSGFQMHISKPINLNELTAVISSIAETNKN